MKKIFLSLILLLALSAGVNAQFISLPIRLVESDGTPHTGQAANIEFTKYPHTYPTDVVSGITITEIGTAGNYVAKGFTTFQYVKLRLSGVEQTWFDSVLTGNIYNFLSSNYIIKAGTVSGITGNKTITSGDWLQTGGTFTLYKPYIINSSPWYTDYTQASSTSLIWQAYGDSVYGIKNWYYDGTKIRLLSSGYKWYGRTATTSPFEINSSHFQWASDKLNLLSSAVMIDSIKHNNVTVGKDSTWIVLGEPVTKWRFLSLKKGYWYNAYPVPDWMWVYRSFDESGTLISSEEFQVINDAQLLHEKSYVKTVDSISITPLDTFSFPQIGEWQVTIPFEYEFEYVTPNNSGYDSLFIAIYNGEPAEEDIKDQVTYKFAFNSGVPFGLRARGQLIFRHTVTTGTIGNLFYLAGLTSGICHSAGGSAKTWIRRTKVELLKVH